MVSQRSKRLTVALREQISDARLLLDSASHNAAIVLKKTDDLDESDVQALVNAAAQAAQDAGTLRRIEKALRD